MDFDDCRSKKVVFLAHCLLNQNARSPGCAEHPAGVVDLIDGLLRRDVGIVQIPCPELHVLNLARGEVDIRGELETDRGRAACRDLAAEVVRQIRQYTDCGVAVLGVLGKNNSPSCGVETTYREGRCGGMGVFVGELVVELERSGLKVPISGTLDGDPQAALGVVDSWMQRSKAES